MWRCDHDEPVTVWRRVTAGSGHGLVPLGAVVLDLAGQYKPVVTVRGMRTPMLTSPVVTVAWPDMGTPRLDFNGWATLARALTATKRPVHVQCAVGHGRTGTALAILGTVWRTIPRTADPVAAVRAVYCPSAVETDVQCRYVARVTGCPVRVSGSMTRKTL
jgi:hypothetical protein